VVKLRWPGPSTPTPDLPGVACCCRLVRQETGSHVPQGSWPTTRSTLMNCRKRAALFVSCAVLLAQSTDCPGSGYVLYRFELKGCPDEAFSLPDSVAEPPYTIWSTTPGRGRPECPGYQIYEFLQKAKESPRGTGPTPFYVRLKRGQYCSVEVAVRVIGSAETYRELPEPDVVARLVIQGSGVPRPAFAAVSTRKLGSTKDFKRWCARGADRAEASSSTETCS